MPAHAHGRYHGTGSASAVNDPGRWPAARTGGLPAVSYRQPVAGPVIVRLPPEIGLATADGVGDQLRSAAVASGVPRWWSRT